MPANPTPTGGDIHLAVMDAIRTIRSDEGLGRIIHASARRARVQAIVREVAEANGVDIEALKKEIMRMMA